MIVRIDSDAGRTHGWQARAPIDSRRYLSRLFSDRKCGGSAFARLMARQAVRELERQAARMRNR